MLFLGLLTLLQLHAPDPKPWIHRVEIVGDTVWFQGDRGYDSVRVRYCFARRTGAWCRLPRPDPGGSAVGQVPRRPPDSVGLAAGLTLVCHPPAGSGVDCEQFGVRIADDPRVWPLVPQADAATLAMLQKAAHLETDDPPTISEFVTAWAAADDAVWFGLGGGFPEGQGAYGGLLRFDRARKAVETVVHARLADATVTGLAIDGGTLWIGTLHPSEFGPVGSTGVLRRDLRTGRWAALDSAGRHLPDKVIQAVAAKDGAVFIATRDGLAAFDTRTSRWSVRYFHRTSISGSVAHVLAAARPRDYPNRRRPH
ncbi:MAG: hypothetical protein ABR499_21750 [Gemmatimonadaceae bacterium]